MIFTSKHHLQIKICYFIGQTQATTHLQHGKMSLLNMMTINVQVRHFNSHLLFSKGMKICCKLRANLYAKILQLLIEKECNMNFSNTGPHLTFVQCSPPSEIKCLHQTIVWVQRKIIFLVGDPMIAVKSKSMNINKNVRF